MNKLTRHRSPCGKATALTLGLLIAILVAATECLLAATSASGDPQSNPPPVTVSQDADSFTLANGLLTARIEKRSGVLDSLKYLGVEMIAQSGGGANGGYWSSVGRGRPGSRHGAVVLIDPATNGGARAEIACQLHNDPDSPTAPVDADYRYALGRGEHGLCVCAVLVHKPGYPSFGVGEARYCLKLNPEVFDYMTIDADRRRVMPSGYDWDHGAPLNLKEARRMTTGVHKGEAEHKYDYSAVLADTPAYGWSSTKDHVGLWLINPSQEYIGGGPTKAELTGHLDVNPGGLPTLLSMWVGSHYGGTSLSVAQNEAWTKVVGPFVIYCNAAPSHEAMWNDALAQAATEMALWPYAWFLDSTFPPASQRATLTGQIVLRDPLAPDAAMSNVWVGVTAPDYAPPPRSGFGGGFGFGRTNTNFPPPFTGATNFPGRSFGGGFGRGGFPPFVDWQRDAKFYQFWTRADAQGRFTIRNVRPGSYTLQAIADGVLGEFTRTNIIVAAAEAKSLGELAWTPVRHGRTLWEIGVPDRTAREFRHGDHYWQWGLYFNYPKDFPNDVNFVIGKSDWRRDWNYVQPPRFDERNVPVTSEEDEGREDSMAARARSGGRDVRSTTWAINFELPAAPRGKATLRLAFCGTHQGCNVEAFVNGQSIGETGTLPPTSAMQRDGIRAYWVEKPLAFEATRLNRGTNVIKLLSHANSWSQGVSYDCVRLELDDSSASPTNN